MTTIPAEPVTRLDPVAAARPRRPVPWLGSALRRPGLQTALAGGIGVVLTLVIMPPPVYGDSNWVWQSAMLWPDIPDDFPSTVMHHAMRLGTVLPVRLAQEIFGLTQVAWVVASAALAAVFTAGIYATGRALFGWLVGAIALLLIVIHPFFTVVDPFTRNVTASTGGLLPDMPVAGMFSLGIAAIAVAARRTGGRQARWLLAAGLCFGLAYLVREYAAFLFTAIPLAFVLLRIPLRRIVLTAAPMAAILLFELVHNAAVYSDPLARLRVAGGHEAPLAQPLSGTDVLLGFVQGTDSHSLGWVFLAALAVTVAGAAVTRDRRLVLLVGWFVALWLPFTVLGGLLDPVQPTLKLYIERYWFLIYPPIIVGAVATGKLAIEWIRSRAELAGGVALLAVVGVVLAGYLVPAASEFGRVHRDEDWHQLRGWLASHPEVEVLFTDSRGRDALGFYTITATGEVVWDGQVRTFHRESPELPVEQMARPEARLQLVRADAGAGESCVPSLPYLQTRFGAREQPDPAAGWQVLWRSGNGALTIWQCQP